MTFTKWFYQFPDASKVSEEEFGCADVELQTKRISIEVEEALKAFANEPYWRVASELMDVIHAAETAIRIMDIPVQELDIIKALTIKKNADRGYYR